jgi:hypothetical protein
MPRAWGGPELNVLSQLKVIEALSIADASAGWCAMIGADGGYMTACIDQTVAREMYADIDSVTAITFAPPGKAVKKGDGFIVNGRWPFASGCQHATWLLVISWSLMAIRRVARGFILIFSGYLRRKHARVKHECSLRQSWDSLILEVIYENWFCRLSRVRASQCHDGSCT